MKVSYTMMKRALDERQAELTKANDDLREFTMFGKSDTEGVAKREELEKNVSDLKARIRILEGQIKEEEQKMAVTDMKEAESLTVDETSAKASYYKAVADKHTLSLDERKFLGAIDGGATYGNGELLLPVTIQTALQHEAFEVNPLRNQCTYTAIDGLQVPTMDNDVLTSALALIKDGDTAKEIQVKAGMIKFVKERFAVMTTVAESVLNSTNANLVSYIEGTLRSKLALTEHNMMFGLVNDHRNVFNPANEIPVVQGATLYETILTAIYELHPSFLQNAVVVMSPADYVALRKELANSSETLFANGRKEIEGLPIILDAKVGFEGKGIVIGDFRYYQFNYESTSTLRSQLDIRTSLYDFVLSAEMDARIITPLAFKIVKKNA